MICRQVYSSPDLFVVMNTMVHLDVNYALAIIQPVASSAGVFESLSLIVIIGSLASILNKVFKCKLLNTYETHCNLCV